jgi:hypothetical protein
MINLSAQPAELHFTLEITRAETGLTETVEMVGHVIPAEPQPETTEEIK